MDHRPKDWTNILFLLLSPLAGLGGTWAYASRYGIAWWEPLLCLALFMAIGLGIGAGYHRYYAHRTFECHPVVQGFFLVLGAMALQNSALMWARDHRDHHQFVDSDRDPYDARRGFWWSHLLWIFYADDGARGFARVPDLTADRLVMLQHRFRLVLGIGLGLGLPTLVGAAFGRPLGGLLWGGFLRIVLVHHTTFFINSLAHMWGSRPYSEDVSARDNGFLAFFTHGEGYHNFHHRFPADYRNGIRWYHWDPNKWLIRVLASVGLGRALRVTPPPLVEKARLHVALARVERRLAPAPSELREAVFARVDSARRSLDQALGLWQEMLREKRELKALRRPPAPRLEALRQKAEEYEARFRAACDEWRAALEEIPEGVALPA